MSSGPAGPGTAATGPLSERVLVLAPMGRDAPVLCRLLGGNGVACATCRDASEVADGLRAGAGAVLFTAEALTPAAGDRLAVTLAAEPAWSDPPLLLLADVRSGDPLGVVAALRAAGNLTILERPARSLTLVTAVQAALRARRRQYEVRDRIESERSARAEAEAANRVKDEFLANVSHELRTPISAVLLWTKLLARGILPPEQHRQALKSIELSAVAQDQLVGDLLDATRLSSGGIRLDLRDCDPAEAARAAMDLVRPTAEAKGVRLEAGPHPTDLAVRADPARLRQVITNLLSNAVKFTPAGGRVSVRLDRDGDRVRIRVVDTGAGIRPEFLPHVFDRFRQADPTATSRQSGLGLGLAIAKQLVEMHRGTIRVKSPGEGRGATFTVTLPIAVVRPDQPEQEQARPKDGEEGRIPAGTTPRPASVSSPWTTKRMPDS